jgi:uncharacterized protein YbjT (DUF2867 family)
MRIVVAGGTGFVGRRLTAELRDRGHDVVAMTRHPEGDDQVFGDVADEASLRAALDGADAAHYLVHSLDRADFATYDADGARRFAAAASGAGVGRIVYLGGLGDEHDALSAHLRSRREVEHILSARMPTVALRAGIVVGAGSAAWEVLCQLVQRLPAMITPRWVDTRTQPIALDDVVDLLAGAVDVDRVPAGHYDVGAPESVTYRQMMLTIAHELGHHRLIVPVPVLTPRLSSFWLRLVTTVDMQTARNLVDSMTNTVVVHERRLEELTGVTPRPFEQAAREALAEHDA